MTDASPMEMPMAAANVDDGDARGLNTNTSTPADNEVICISDDDEAENTNGPTATARSIKEEGGDGYVLSSPGEGYSRSRGKRRAGVTAGGQRAVAVEGGLRTPPRSRRRLSGTQDEPLKPITPSSVVQSSMNASLVFDMVTSLSTNDPGVAIATLRSIVVLGKEYPSNLLYDELMDRILSVDAVEYADAVSIYSSLVFVFDRAAACSCDVSFPHEWEPIANALQDGSVLPKDELWRRNLLVLQFFVYCFKKDFDVCRQRYWYHERANWIYRTRLFTLLHQGELDHGDGSNGSGLGSGSKRAKNKVKMHNNLMLQAIGCVLQLWKRVFDEDDKFALEAEDACMAGLRLIEMLYLCTDQLQNILQRVQAGLLELTRATRIKFAQAIESTDLKMHLATTVMGLTNKSRSKEHEWYECNALGRVLHTLNQNHEDMSESSDVAITDGYSWSHFDSFTSAKPRNDFTRLLQEIVRLGNENN